MELIKTKLEGLFLIKNNIFEDDRGVFVKIFNSDIFSELSIKTNIQEIFYSESKKNVIRGMHFQLPPFEHDKLVYVTDGTIRDVVLDIRTNSKTYGCNEFFELNSLNRFSIFIPKGFAHGFEVISSNATVIYQTSRGYAPKNDTGIKWNSFGANWETKNPIISIRDNSFIKFNDFKSPF